MPNTTAKGDSPMTTIFYSPFTISAIADALFYDGRFGPLTPLPPFHGRATEP